jgi:hypothetical protein
MSPRSPLAVRVAIATVAAVLLLVQITATRLLSASVSYHGAFGILGLVMLGLAASAAAAFRDRSTNPIDDDRPAANAADTAALALIVLSIGYVAASMVPGTLSAAAMLVVGGAGLYAVFHWGGYAVAWLLSHWHHDVSRVYFSDLLGAATGCAIAVPLLGMLSPQQLLLVFALASVGAGVLLRRGTSERPSWGLGAVAVAVLVASFVMPSLLSLRNSKGLDQSDVLYEKWDPLSRVTVLPAVPGTQITLDALRAQEPGTSFDELARRWSSGWGLSSKYDGETPRTLWLQHDTDAGTPIFEGGGTRPLSDFEILGWDVTSVAYWLRKDQLDRTFVIGGGGGRDILAALSFGTERVDVVELNPTVLDTVQNVFGEYSGRPYTREGVHHTIGEARSVLSRSSDRYDLIQMSMIDTWAASASGALTLSENALYTREAFQIFLDHLEPDGLLTVSRWHESADNRASGSGWWARAESARVLALMHDALTRNGAAHPEEHVVVVATPSSGYAFGVANCILKPTPFTPRELATVRGVADRMGFDVLWPADVPNPQFDAGAILSAGYTAVPDVGLDLSPPTDDRPFFFNTRRPVTSWVLAIQQGNPTIGSGATLIFVVLMTCLLVAARAFVWKPLAEVEAARPAHDRVQVSNALPELAYFGGIGVAFLFVELGVLQRYILFLGHPTYAVSVVLLALLVSTAVGALITDRRPGVARIALPCLLVLLLATAFVVPPVLQAAHGWPLSARVPFAIALVIPLGVCMGVAWPTGVAGLSASGRSRLVPYVWAINGVGGTLASVAGMTVATAVGYTALLLLGTAVYAMVVVLLYRLGWGIRIV